MNVYSRPLLNSSNRVPEEEKKEGCLENLDSDNFWIVFNHYMKFRSVKRAFNTVMINGKKHYVLPNGLKISAVNFKRGILNTSMKDEYEKMQQDE